MATSTKYALMSQEGERFEVEKEVAQMSVLVKEMTEEDDDDDELEVPLPNVKCKCIAMYEGCVE